MRLTLSEEEVVQLVSFLSVELEKEDGAQELLSKIKKQWLKPIKPSKRNATKKATEAKKEATRNKITNAVNLMRLEGKKITPYSVAKESGVSYNSCTKYSFLYQNDISK